MPVLDASARSLVPTRPFNPATWRADRAAGLARMAANARPDPDAQRRPVVVAVSAPEPAAPPPEPKVNRDTPVAVRHEDGTVTYRSAHGPLTRHAALAHRRILQVVGEHFGFSASDLRAPRQDAKVVRARQIAYWMLRAVKGLSQPEIGRVLGGRDPSTVLHGISRVDAKIARGDAETIAAIAAVRAKLGIGGEP